MRRILIASFFTLTACGAADTGARPAVEIRTVVQKVEVARPCAVTPPVRPAPLARPLPTDGGALAALLAAKLLDYAGPGGFADRALAAIKQCVTP